MISGLRSLRVRITLISTAVLVVVLGIAAMVIVNLVDRQLRNELSAQNEATLGETVDRIERGDARTSR